MSYNSNHSSAGNARNQQISAQNIQRFSDELINGGINAIKRNPIPSGLYVVGVLVCLFFSGHQPTAKQEELYNSTMRKIDHQRIGLAARNLHETESLYRGSKGWFTCDKRCQSYKIDYDIANNEFKYQRSEEQRIIADAKSNVGIFSSFGVEEARDIFWRRFSDGKKFAKRQTMWDAMFMGMSAMAKDESITEYIARLALRMLCNFTAGLFVAVGIFIFSLYSLIQSYRTNIIAGMFFFIFASIASVSFAMSWILGLYAGAAGTVYVCSKVASNMRIQDGRQQQYGGRVRDY